MYPRIRVAGNRTQQVVMVGAIPKLTGYTYDNNGNLTDDGVNEYVWDKTNRLLSMGGASYGYDGLGNRVSQTVSSTVTQFLLDLQPGLPLTLADSDGTDTTRYVHGPKGIQQQQNPDDAWLWIAQDALGSVRSVIDEALTPLEVRLTDPYGKPILNAAYNYEATSFGFTGEWTDQEVGQIYLRKRNYTPILGVFASHDPFEGKTCTPMSLNGYMWVEGNIINRTDPSGQIPWIPGFGTYNSVNACGIPDILSQYPLNNSGSQIPTNNGGQYQFAGNKKPYQIPNICIPGIDPECTPVLPPYIPPSDPFTPSPEDNGDDPEVLQFLCDLGNEHACMLLTQSQPQKQNCPPCPRPNPACHVNRVPPSIGHPPCQGDHYHEIEVHQRPSDCKCNYKRQNFLTIANCLPKGGVPPNPPCDTWI